MLKSLACLNAHNLREKTVATSFVFPGQGSQAIGMGKMLADNFAAARAVFAEVDDALNQTPLIVVGGWEQLHSAGDAVQL